MKSVKPKQIINLLESKGFKYIRQKGSHKLYRKENFSVTVPYHNKDLKPGTLRSILRQSGLEKEEI